MSVSLQNTNIKITFGESPLMIDQLQDLNRHYIICEGAQQCFLLRLPDAISDPILLTKGKWLGSGMNWCQFRCVDISGQYHADVTLTLTDSGLHLQSDWHSQKPLWLVEWRLNNLNIDYIIIPALGGQQLTTDMPDGAMLSYKYPFWWNAQFVIGQSDNQSGIWLYSHDSKPNLKLLRVRKQMLGFEWTYGYEVAAPLKKNSVQCDWYVETYHNGWKGVVEQYRSWMEPAFQLQPLQSRRDIPKWSENIHFILEVWGANRESDIPFHTFDEIESRLYEWEKLYTPAETLLYLPGFAGNGIDSRVPDYHPSVQMGGRNGFKHLVNTAHKLGYRVMVHTNVLAMTFSHPQFREFRKYQIKDAFGRLMGWGLDIDGDWVTEPYFAYINPGCSKWGELMTAVLGELIAEYDVDAIFLDQTLLAFNVSNGPNFITGMRKHVERLQKAFPNIFFAGEGLHEQIAKPFTMAQIHGIDSITNVRGMDDSHSWRRVHPVSATLFGRYTRYTAHLLTRHPSHTQFKHQEAAYKKLGVIPALCLYNSKQKMDLPQTRAMIVRAKNRKSRRI